jgi:hypothetical protein
MSIENYVIEKIKELLPKVNIGNTDYNYDWSNCTINKENNDVNSVKESDFPYVDMEFYPDEVCDNTFNNTQWYANILTMQIDCIPVKKNTTRENVDHIVKDIKRFFGNNHLGEPVFTIGYYGYRRFTAQTQGNFYGVRMTFKVKYFEDKINP